MASQDPQDTPLHSDGHGDTTGAPLDVAVPSTVAPDAGDGASETDRICAVHAAIRRLLGDDLDAAWDDVLSTWTGANAEARTAVRADVDGLRNRVLRSLIGTSTMDELEYGVAIQYVELRCHWTMLNARIQHQTAQGRPDDPLLYRATCVSQIIDALESLLPPESVDHLSAFVAEPLRQSRAHVDSTSGA